MGMLPFIGEKVFQRGEQKGAEAATLLSHRRQVFLEQNREEGLRQILRIVRSMAAPPHISIERIPVSPAELVQGFVRAGRRIIPGREHNTPVSGGELGFATRQWLQEFTVEGHTPSLPATARLCTRKAGLPAPAEYHRVFLADDFAYIQVIGQRRGGSFHPISPTQLFRGK
jgi:hypothetical protein